MTIAVTAASGHLGRLVVEQLLLTQDPGDLVAVVRDPAKVADLADRGLTVRAADYADGTALRAAFAGVDRLLFVSGSDVGHRMEQHTSVIEAAQAAGVGLVAYTSAPRATDTPLALAAEHRATEELLVASGVPSVMLRNNWYVENLLGALDLARTTGEHVAATGTGRTAYATRADYAAAAAVVLTTDGHEGAVYELGADVGYDGTDIAAAFEDVLGRPVAYVPVDAETRLAGLVAAGLDEGTAAFVTGMETDIAAGCLDVAGHDLSRLVGRPPTSLRDGLAAAL